MNLNVLRFFFLVTVITIVCLKTVHASNQFTLNPNAFEQWLIWEETANFPDFKKSTAPVSIAFTLLSNNEANSELIGSGKLFSKTFSAGRVPWFYHPYNTELSVPFADKEKTNELSGRLTSSASIAVFISGRYYSLKIPTDRPFHPKDGRPDEIKGPTSTYQPKKADRRLDTTVGAARGQYVAAVNKLIGEDPSFVILNEVGKIQDRVSGNGILVRDINILNDGHYYLPAHSLPYVGEEIAVANNTTWENFMAEHYARPLGKLYARLLLRYGLVPEAHNPQNVLIQLDRNLKPTGKLVFRDLSDTSFVKSIVGNSLEFQNIVDNEKKMGQRLAESMSTNTQHLFWMMGSKIKSRATILLREKIGNEAAIDDLDLELIGRSIVQKATAAYKESFYNEIEKSTGVSVLAGVPEHYGSPIDQKFQENKEFREALMKSLRKGPDVAEKFLRRQLKTNNVVQCRSLFM